MREKGKRRKRNESDREVEKKGDWRRVNSG